MWVSTLTVLGSQLPMRLRRRLMGESLMGSEPVLDEIPQVRTTRPVFFHAVQFYQSDDALSASVSRFLKPGILAGDPILLLATPSHTQAIDRCLASQGIDVCGLYRTRRAVAVTDTEVLASIVVDGEVIAERFFTVVKNIIGQVHGERVPPHVLVYGELVDTLSKQGNFSAAVRLETLWNDLGETHPSLSLLCGYALSHFEGAANQAAFEQVCIRHTDVEGTEPQIVTHGTAAHRAELVGLEQQAIALQTELDRRVHLERDLLRLRADLESLETERQRLVAAERVARREVEIVNTLKDEFLAVLSHELRTPLNAILGWIQIITGPTGHDGTLKRGLEVIQRNALTQLRLVDDLLDISHIVRGTMVVEKVDVDLTEVVKDAVMSIRSSAAAKGIDVQTSIDHLGRLVRGDYRRLFQIVWNLLSNSVKFTPPHGRIDVRLCTNDGHAVLTVQDNGKGISPHFLPYVFDRFRQADTGLRRAHGGLGLGLALVRYLVEAHCGSVSAMSDGEGQGATFIVELPLR